MKKKLFLIAATFMLMFSFAGQAMASFANGDLIQVVFTTDGSGAEVATDLGSFTAITSGSVTDKSFSNTINMANFSGYSTTDLSVAYFVYNGASGNLGLWVTSSDGGLTTNGGGNKMTAQSLGGSLLTYYKSISSTATTVVGSASNGNSYNNSADQASNTGNFGGVIDNTNGSMDATLSATGYVDQYLYYFAMSTLNGSVNGVEVADIRTYADGHTEIIPLVSTPLPAAVWLLGSGLIGLVGIRRRGTEVLS